MIAISMLISLYLYFQFNGGEWTCIAEQCVEYAEGDDWVKQNCALQGSEMICEFTLQGQNFRVPLSGVNVSNMISCNVYECTSEVLVRKMT